MTEAEELFERQARWQRARRDLSWPEKIRMAEELSESVRRLKDIRQSAAASSGASGKEHRMSKAVRD
ncbi:MAG: hypothetical protein ACC661_02425 [Verrucomicrobiales bacterium]